MLQGHNNYVGNAVYSAGVDWASEKLGAMFISGTDDYVSLLNDAPARRSLPAELIACGR